MEKKIYLKDSELDAFYDAAVEIWNNSTRSREKSDKELFNNFLKSVWTAAEKCKEELLDKLSR